MVTPLIKKEKSHTIVEKIQYYLNEVLKKTTVNTTASSFNSGEEIAEKTSPFVYNIQIIDGTAEIISNTKKYKLTYG